MKIEEAIEILKQWNKDLSEFQDEKEGIECHCLAISALEKQIPKKPIDEFSTHAIYDNDGNYMEQLDITIFKCPVCNYILSSGEIDITDCAEIHYCDNCGQALDWGERNMTQYERIKNMSIDDMANFIHELITICNTTECEDCKYCDTSICMSCYEAKDWLESEVRNEKL